MNKHWKSTELFSLKFNFEYKFTVDNRNFSYTNKNVICFYYS